jgi:hypothetical protein
MWPFTKNKEPEPNRTQECIDRLKAFRDIGETFDYLGRTCIVTGHAEFYPYIGIIPVLKFDYADDHGVIHCMSANIRELPALVNQQESNAEVSRDEH